MVELVLYDWRSEREYVIFDGNSLPEETKTVGRNGQESDIGIFYPEMMIERIYIAGKHCLFEKFGSDFTVRDLRSRIGTYLNGEEVTTSGFNGDLLENCDVLRIGFYRVEVIIRK